MSKHEVLVVSVEKVMNHSNADALEILKLSGYDYSVITRKGQFKVGDLGIFVEPDYVVPTTHSKFAFLHDGKRDTLRITAKRLRGVWSEGLFVPAEPHHVVGTNVMEEYNIQRWEPPPPRNSGGNILSGITESGPVLPFGNVPTYSVENYKKFSSLVPLDSDVFYSVKIHGANFRCVYWEDKMHCGSRTEWKRQPGTTFKVKEDIEVTVPNNTWWDALKQNPWLEEWCRNNPGEVIYGEVFGTLVQGAKFHYGYRNNQLGVRVFDVLENGRWVPFVRLCDDEKYASLQLVPVLHRGLHDVNKLMELAESNEDMFSNCGTDHIREGIVVRSVVGNITLKYVSNNYLTKS